MGIWILVIAVALLVLLEIVVILRRRKKFSERDAIFIVKEWLDIQAHLDGNPKHAVMEADKLLDFVLKKLGYTGTLGEKLKLAKFRHPDKVWSAHKLRNRVVHEAGFELLEQEARKALSAYRQAFHDLGVKLDI